VITAIRSELLKIRTTRMPAGLLAVAAGWTALVATIESARSGPGGLVPALSGGGLRDVLTSTGFGLIMAMVFGVTLATGEFRYKTATDTYLDEPSRTQVLAAKIVTACIGGLVFGLAATAVTITAGLTFTAAKGFPVALSAATIARYSAGAILAAGLLAAAGAGLGSLIRSQVGAIIAVFAWCFGIEQILGGLSHRIAPYLPFTAAASMAGAANGAMPPMPSGMTPLPFAAVAGLLAALAIVIAAVTARTTLRRDIT
jgi:ABC-2 type transport system permease protein